MNKTILVAIDGSVYSGNSLDYLARLFLSDRNLSIHLLSVAPSGGAGKEWMLEVDPLRGQSPEAEKRARQARRTLKEAEDRLVRHGIAAERIESRVRIASGVSSAIREEAERGQYDCVLVGRRGLGSMGSMFFGSTSGELIEKCHRTPLWIVDGQVTEDRFLLAVHSRPSSLMAADHLAFMLKDHPTAEILLYHSNAVFSSQHPSRAEEFHEQWGRAWCEQYLDIENFLFQAHAQLLAENGIPRRRISQLPMQMHLDIGSDLLRQARQHRCGTIVIGRRRRDQHKGQLTGVSDKTLKQAQNIAVWLAG